MSDNNNFNMILQTDQFILQRMSLDGAPHMTYSAADLERFVADVFVKSDADLEARIAGLEYTSARHTTEINELQSDLSLFKEDTIKEFADIARHQGVQDTDIKRIDKTLTEYLNQSRNFGTFIHDKDVDPMLNEPGHLYFNGSGFEDTDQIILPKTDYYGAKFSYDNIMVGEVLEFRAYRETGDLEQEDITPLARVIYTINAITGRTADPNTPVIFSVTVQYAIGILEDQMVMVTEVFPNFDPDLKADLDFVNSEVKDLQDQITDNHAFSVKNAMPPGAIVAWYANNIPDGWFLCNGSSFSGTENPGLKGVLGGTTTPNLQGKYLVMGGNHGLSSVVGSTVDQETALPTTKEFKTDGAGSHNHWIGTVGWDPSGTKKASTTFRNQSGGDSDKYSDSQPNHSHKVTGGDSYTRPYSVIIKYIIKGG